MTAEPEFLSEDDARILALESAAVAGHTLKLLILEPGETLDLDGLRHRVRMRIRGRASGWTPGETGRAGRRRKTSTSLVTSVGTLSPSHRSKTCGARSGI